MGRKNKKYSKNLHQQAYERITSMQAFGESRHTAKKTGADSKKIYSYSTYSTYWNCIKRYISWLKKEHNDCKTLNNAKNYITEWIQFRINSGVSAWTVHTEAAALVKLFQDDRDDYIKISLPKRRREDIKRSRDNVNRDRHFSVKNNSFLIKFCKGTGCRRGVLERLEGRDLWSKNQLISRARYLGFKYNTTPEEQLELICIKEALYYFPDEKWFIHHRRDKGGRSRFAPIIGDNVERIVEKMKQAKPNEKVWQHVHSACDVHGYRAEYATDLYKKYARNIADIPYDSVNAGTGYKYQSQVYCCRRDEQGIRLDKKAMLICSKALGHNRINVVSENYIRGL